jgi:hypothetical protein
VERNTKKMGVMLVIIACRVGQIGLFVPQELSAETKGHVSGNDSLLDMIAAPVLRYFSQMPRAGSVPSADALEILDAYVA